MHEGSWLESGDALGLETSATGLEHSWFEGALGPRRIGEKNRRMGFGVMTSRERCGLRTGQCLEARRRAGFTPGRPCVARNKSIIGLRTGRIEGGRSVGLIGYRAISAAAAIKIARPN